jgi:hypothetical protein
MNRVIDQRISFCGSRSLVAAAHSDLHTWAWRASAGECEAKGARVSRASRQRAAAAGSPRSKQCSNPATATANGNTNWNGAASVGELHDVSVGVAVCTSVTMCAVTALAAVHQIASPVLTEDVEVDVDELAAAAAAAATTPVREKDMSAPTMAPVAVELVDVHVDVDVDADAVGEAAVVGGNSWATARSVAVVHWERNAINGEDAGAAVGNKRAASCSSAGTRVGSAS